MDLRNQIDARRTELLNLYHLARTPLGTAAGRFDRMRWATEQYLKTHPTTLDDKYSTPKAVWLDMEYALMCVPVNR